MLLGLFLPIASVGRGYYRAGDATQLFPSLWGVTPRWQLEMGCGETIDSTGTGKWTKSGLDLFSAAPAVSRLKTVMGKMLIAEIKLKSVSWVNTMVCKLGLCF